jgi:hypothetical protein
MGQFYKGTEAAFLDDKMYKAPYELMGQVIAKKDKEVEDAVKANDALNAMLDAKGLKADDPRLQQIIGDYTNKVGDISSGIYGDAMNAATYMPKIESLKRKITTDFKMGEVAKIQGNLANYTAWEEETKKQIDKAGNKISPQQWELLKTKKLQEFTQGGGTNYKNSSTYNTFAGDALLEKKPADVFMDDIFKEAVGRVKSVSWDNDKGLLQIKGERGTEGWDEAKLKSMYTSALLADPSQLGAMRQLNDLGVPGYQESMFNEKGQPILDNSVNNAFSKEIEYAKQKYGIVTTKVSNSVLNNEKGNQEYAYGIKQRDEEQPVGFTFADTEVHPLTHDYNTYNKTTQDIVASKNALFTTVANKLNIQNADARKKLGQQIGRGDYSAFAGIPDSDGYVEQFKQLFAKQALQTETEKNYTSWANGRTKDAKGNVIINVTEKGKTKKVAVDPKSPKGKARLFNIYVNQKGFEKNPVVNYTADNVVAGVGAKATVAIGKALNDLGGNLSLNLHTAKNMNAVYTSIDGKSKVRLVPPEYYKNFSSSKTATYTDGKVYKVDDKGNFIIPALESNGNIQAQNLVNLGLASSFRYKPSVEDPNDPAEPGEGGAVIGGLTVSADGNTVGTKYNELTFKTGSARLVDRNVNGKPVFAMPVTGGDFSVVATVDASTIQEPAVQAWINDPGRKALQVYNDWKQMVPPNLSPVVTSNGLQIGKDSKHGWYIMSKQGKYMSPAEAGKTQENLMSLYYKKSRQE